VRSAAGLLLAGWLAAPVAAQEAETAPAVDAWRPEAFVSSDSDGNDTRRVSLGWDWSRRDLEHWRGLRVEQARFSGIGWDDTSTRVFVRAAGSRGAWRWRGEAGTDGHDLIGSASLHSEDAWRKEFFIERDVLETREGFALGRVHTFAGAALDVPLSERWGAAGLVGLQDFGGENLRTHVRAQLWYALLPEQGLSLQLRLRHFEDSDPNELDYFAPGRYRQALATISLRRFVRGYRWRAVAGFGRQDFTGAGSQPSRLFELDVQTPEDRGHFLRATAGWSDAPAAGATGGTDYVYRYLRFEGVWTF
jgi:hypothetical protein